MTEQYFFPDGFIIETPYIETRDCGVYMVRNRINNKCYVGSSVDVKNRAKEHRSGKGNGLLAKAVRKYGKENFDFFLLEICPREELHKREGFWMQQLPKQYNLVDVLPTGRRSYSEDEARKRTEHFKGKPLSEEHKQKIRSALKGKKLTADRKEKIRQKALGRKLTPEHRKALSEAQRRRRSR
jgi:group I intron endonuclease